MRSGIPLLSGHDIEPRNNVVEMRPSSVPAREEAVPAPPSELDSPVWSVLSFDQRQAGGLTFHQASHLMQELDQYRIPGLCIVTDAAASRLTS